MTVYISQHHAAHQTQRTKKIGSKNQFAKLFVILIAWAATADAFQPIALRSLPFRTSKLNGHSQRFDYLNLRQWRKTQPFTKELRAAGTLDSETAYYVAQARLLDIDKFR